MAWKKYRKVSVAEMRPFEVGETLDGVSVSPWDSPEEGGMIARNPDDHKDKWYVSKAFFQKNYELIP